VRFKAVPPRALLDDIPACAITLNLKRRPRCRLLLKKKHGS